MTPAEWLEQQENTSEVRSVTLSAMTRSWEGAVYTIDGSDAPCIYLLGVMPTNALNLCFRFEGDDRDWYVACYYQYDPKHLEPHQKKYHPFGRSWILHPWTLDYAIDYHSDKKCKRIQARIE